MARVLINGIRVEFGNQPLFVQQYTQTLSTLSVPLYGLFDALGFEIELIGTSAIRVSHPVTNTVLMFVRGEPSFQVGLNGATLTRLDIEFPVEIDNRTRTLMMPIGIPLRAAGYGVTWSQATQTAVITTGTQGPIRAGVVTSLNLRGGNFTPNTNTTLIVNPTTITSAVPATIVPSSVSGSPHMFLRVVHNGNNYWAAVQDLNNRDTDFLLITPRLQVPGRPPGANNLVTEQMMLDFGWRELRDGEINTINNSLNKYGITDMRSIRLFMATCGHESRLGSASLEGLTVDGTTLGNHVDIRHRGAGYIQLTGQVAHQNFLRSVNSSFTGTNTAVHISQNYPWEAAMWYWSSTVARNTAFGSINDYVVRFGDALNIFLLTQLFVWQFPRFTDRRYFINEEGDRVFRRMTNDHAIIIRENPYSRWSISDTILKVDDDEFEVPLGWATPQTGRRDCYQRAKQVFR